VLSMVTPAAKIAPTPAARARSRISGSSAGSYWSMCVWLSMNILAPGRRRIGPGRSLRREAAFADAVVVGSAVVFLGVMTLGIKGQWRKVTTGAEGMTLPDDFDGIGGAR